MRGETCLARVRSISRDPSPPASTPETLRGTHARCSLGMYYLSSCPARIVQRPSECLRECQLASVSMLKISYVRTVQTLAPPLLVPKSCTMSF